MSEFEMIGDYPRWEIARAVKELKSGKPRYEEENRGDEQCLANAFIHATNEPTPEQIEAVAKAMYVAMIGNYLQQGIVKPEEHPWEQQSDLARSDWYVTAKAGIAAYRKSIGAA